MQTTKYERKSFDVDAVQVTDATIEAIAEWCKGTIVDDGREAKHIKIEVTRIANERQSQAFMGDWVLYAGTGFKVYTDKAFRKCFAKKKEAESTPVAATVPVEPSFSSNQ